jgi:hypothetical protein
VPIASILHGFVNACSWLACTALQKSYFITAFLFNVIFGGNLLPLAVIHNMTQTPNYL